MNLFKPKWRSAIICLSVFLTACIQLNPIASEQMATGAAAPATLSASDTLQPISPSLIDTAISNPVRRRADRDKDERRKAAEVLGFFGIEAGMVVLDLYSGGGYYAELLSLVVGPTGRVVAHNNTAYLSFAKNELATRYTGGRLGNVEQLIAENNKLELAPDSFDAIFMIKAYHDVYYIDEGAGWEEIDRAKFLHEIFTALKPGGVLGIIDHAADPGARPETGGTLHRIDPALIKRDMTEAGFIFDGESDILRNPADDRLQAVFSPSVRDKTDRVVLRFRKP